MIDTFVGNKGVPQSKVPKFIHATDDRDGVVSCTRPMKAEVSKTSKPGQVPFEWLHIAKDYQSLKIWQVGKLRDHLWRCVIVHGKHDDMMIMAEADAAEDRWQSARVIRQVESVIALRRQPVRIAGMLYSCSLKELRLGSLHVIVPGTMGKYYSYHESHGEHCTHAKLEPPHLPEPLRLQICRR